MTVAEPDAGPPSDPVTEQVLRQAQLIAELRRDLDRLAHDTTDTLIAVHDRIGDLEAAPRTDHGSRYAGQVQAWCWRTLGPLGQETLWAELIEWVTWLRTRYPLARKIPSCWRQHPEIVEELTALWLAWQAAYTEPDQPLTAPIDWHDRWLPGLLHRLEHGPFAFDCNTTHKARPTSSYASCEPSRSETERC